MKKMTNIIKQRRQAKKEIIKRITLGLKELIKKYGKNFPLNFERVIMTIQAEIGCSRRTASDYANLGLFNVDMTRSDLPFNSRGYNIKLKLPEFKEGVTNE